MKYFSLLMVLFLLLIPACKKNNSNIEKPIHKDNNKSALEHKLTHGYGEFVLSSMSFRKEADTSVREEKTLTFNEKENDVELKIKTSDNNELAWKCYTGRYELKNDDIYITFEYEVIADDINKSAGGMPEPDRKIEMTDFKLTLYWRESLNGYLTEEQLKYLNNNEYTHNKNWYYFIDKDNDNPAKAQENGKEYFEDGYYH
jgi:hypothetical protein